MTMLTRERFKTLAREERGPCVSLYMPTHRESRATKEDPIRFKNLLKEAQRQILSYGLSQDEADKILEPASNLLQESSFWWYQSDGLAMFITPHESQYFKLPHEFEELVVVTDSFHLKPLIPVLSGCEHFYLLALSQNETRLFQGTKYGIIQG